MPYSRPAFDSANATWEGAAAYARPAYNAADAPFVDSPSGEFDDGIILVTLALSDVALSAAIWAEQYFLPGVRLYVGGVEYPAASLQCNRRLGASTWMSIEIPAWSAELEAAMLASIGDQIDIRKDNLFWLSAVLTEVASERSAHSASITLTARVQTPTYTQTHRVLAGVSDRRTDDGRRSCRCDIDQALRPNDTVDDGVETWTAGIVAYRITPNEGRMDVTEVFDG